jgi:hypothetical protein
MSRGPFTRWRDGAVRDRAEEAEVRGERAGGRRPGSWRLGSWRLGSWRPGSSRPGSSRPGGRGWDAAGLRSLAIHAAIVGLAGVFVLAALALAAVAGVVTGTALPSVPAVSVPGPAVPGPAARASGGPSRAQVISAVVGDAGWRTRTVTRLSPLMTSTAVDPAGRAAYELVARRPGGTGPFRLWRIGLSGGSARAAAVGGAVRGGPAFPVSEVSVAGGFVWVSGDLSVGSSPSASSGPVLYQVSPRTLTVVASWRLPGRPGRYAPVSVAAGPAGTVWVGSGGTLRQLRARTSATVRQARLPGGLLASDIAVDPAARHLYVAGEGRLGGVTALEYGARTGRLLATAARSPLRFSVGGAALTAVPGGVWASFRTGMLGQTVLLRQAGLGSVLLPASYLPGVPPASVQPDFYRYAMGASTGYGGGALWLSQGTGGLTGCVAPRTGQVRSVATLRLLVGGGELLGVRPTARQVFAAGPSGLIVITAPARCWA